MHHILLNNVNVYIHVVNYNCIHKLIQFRSIPFNFKYNVLCSYNGILKGLIIIFVKWWNLSYLLLLLSLLLLLLLLSLLFLLKKISFKCKFKLYIMMVEHNSFVCIKLQGVSYLGAKEKAPTLQFIVKFITFFS